MPDPGAGSDPAADGVRGAAGRAVAEAAALTLAWHVVLVAAAYGLPPLSPSWFPDLGATVVNLAAAVVPVAVVVRRGWGDRPWLRTAWPRRPLLLVPVLAVALSYAAPGIEGGAGVLLSSAVLFLVLGASEELQSRGVVQEVLAPLRPRPRVLCVGVLFGLGHVLSAVAFGRPVDDTVAQVVSTTAFGAGFAALRLHTVALWPLALLHGLDDWCQVNSPGAAPWWWQLAVAVGYAAAAWELTRPHALAAPPDRRWPRMSR
ncbi:CPBP family intramembrane metalloprotease [Geodermatophilus sp. TF02-6]|uniref:CPBP family intramembrane glutamic endopeptidase n=1 Tax=Geodermatophilus sp. TF02-6 TaxID=2250575 RepID=UPI000DE84023|nr:CPBP family intramembrane glutamic endopeptidase [Geodermatophilus sp. TF02-6]RBY77125.1 CPBP family intramembrane metalloprotease [Geodermatophilus sp. TF02-6]